MEIVKEEDKIFFEKDSNAYFLNTSIGLTYKASQILGEKHLDDITDTDLKEHGVNIIHIARKLKHIKTRNDPANASGSNSTKKEI